MNFGVAGIPRANGCHQRTSPASSTNVEIKISEEGTVFIILAIFEITSEDALRIYFILGSWLGDHKANHNLTPDSHNL